MAEHNKFNNPTTRWCVAVAGAAFIGLSALTGPRLPRSAEAQPQPERTAQPLPEPKSKRPSADLIFQENLAKLLILGPTPPSFVHSDLFSSREIAAALASRAKNVTMVRAQLIPEIEL